MERLNVTPACPPSPLLYTNRNTAPITFPSRVIKHSLAPEINTVIFNTGVTIANDAD